MILIIDFGSQYTQLIAKRIRNLRVYCEIKPYFNYSINDSIKGVILSGSPYSVNDKQSPKIDLSHIKVPILGICYGAQLIAFQYGADIHSLNHKEYGSQQLKDIIKENKLIRENYHKNMTFWMSHSDSITNYSNKIEPLIFSTYDILAGFKIHQQDIYGIQFHPEVTQTEYGNQILQNFLDICSLKSTWSVGNMYHEIESNISKVIFNQEHLHKKIVMAVSGGIDSTLSAYIINKIAPTRLLCVFVNNGLLRKDEVKDVMNNYHKIGIPVTCLEHSDLFLSNLKGITNPEEKRKIIGTFFINSFLEYCNTQQLKASNCLLGQGTIYPDIIESVKIEGVNIKSHHNVGGLPDKLDFTLLEPIKYLFKDDVRALAKYCQIPDFFTKRHPFPGPGLAIRIMGDITPSKIHILQEADKIYIDYLKNNELYDNIWQAGSILLSTKSVGVMGDARTYQYVLALRAVVSIDGMTAECYQFKMQDLINISNKIINNVDGINRVVYDVSSKPPATIEWE